MKTNDLILIGGALLLVYFAFNSTKPKDKKIITTTEGDEADTRQPITGFRISKSLGFLNA